jgi:hypothetical protein
MMFPFPAGGFRRPIDDGDISTLQSCLPPVPHRGVVGQSWRFIPPRRTIWSMDSSDGGHAGADGTVHNHGCLTGVARGAGDT